MNQHPAAWLPSRVVASQLLKLAQALRLVPMTADESRIAKLPDGRQSLTMQAGTEPGSFPAEIRGSHLWVPPIIVDFHIWQYVPARIISIPPEATRGTWWLSMTIIVDCDGTSPLGELSNLSPVHASVNPPTFSWIEDDGSLPSFQPGVAAFDPREYYFYLVTMTDGVITSSPGLSANAYFH